MTAAQHPAEQPVALVTCADERYADPEIAIVADGLRSRGVPAQVVSWDDDREWAAYRLVVVRSTWDYFERLAQFVEWVTRVDLVTHIVNPVDVLRWNTHKGYLVEMASRGVPTVPTRLIPSEACWRVMTPLADRAR